MSEMNFQGERSATLDGDFNEIQRKVTYKAADHFRKIGFIYRDFQRDFLESS